MHHCRLMWTPCTLACCQSVGSWGQTMVSTLNTNPYNLQFALVLLKCVNCYFCSVYLNLQPNYLEFCKIKERSHPPAYNFHPCNIKHPPTHIASIQHTHPYNTPPIYTTYTHTTPIIYLHNTHPPTLTYITPPTHMTTNPYIIHPHTIHPHNHTS